MRRPSKRPPRKMSVFGVVWDWELGECSNAVMGGEGKPPVFGRGMRWRIPGWVSEEAMTEGEGEEEELFLAFVVD